MFHPPEDRGHRPHRASHKTKGARSTRHAAASTTFVATPASQHFGFQSLDNALVPYPQLSYQQYGGLPQPTIESPMTVTTTRRNAQQQQQQMMMMANRGSPMMMMPRGQQQPQQFPTHLNETHLTFTNPSAQFHVIPRPGNRQEHNECSTSSGDRTRPMQVATRDGNGSFVDYVMGQNDMLLQQQSTFSPLSQTQQQLSTIQPGAGQLVGHESGGTIGNTQIVYDIYDVDAAPSHPVQETWYPLAFYYRSAE